MREIQLKQQTMKTKVFLLFALIFTLAKGYSQTRLVKVNDTLRQFTIYQSSKIADTEKVPVLLNFHGSGMTAIEHMLYTNTNKLAEDKGFIVVYPQGINNDWNVGFEQDYDRGSKDVEFINLLIEKLAKNYPIDTTKVYAIGLSRGGFFVQRLVSEIPEQIAGFASIGAPMPTEVKNRTSSTTPIKALYVHGTADKIVNKNGKKDAYLSHDESIEYWKKRNKVKGNPIIKTIDTEDDGSSVELIDYGTLKAVTIENGGHTWPNTDPFNVGLPLGNTTQDIDFNTLVYQFLFQPIK